MMRSMLRAGMVTLFMAIAVGLLAPVATAAIGDADGHDGDTLVIDNVYSNHGGGNYYVGYTGNNNTLIVTNGGMLGNAAKIYVGAGTGTSTISTNNLVQV